MSRRVTHDGNGALLIRFPFDRSLVDLIKTLPHRRWNATDRVWWVPESDVTLLVDLLHDRSFSFDERTRELYTGMGGKRPLDAAVEAPAIDRMPGLFDALPVGGGTASETKTAESSDFTVSKLNDSVRAVLERAFPEPVWLVGEISGFNKNAHRRHVSFDLAEHTDGGDTVSKVGATLFQGSRKIVEDELRRAGDPFHLEDEITVRLRVRVELYVPWGSYRVIVEGIDVNYTLGEAARRREEIIRSLTAAGLVGVNSELPIPSLPLRVGLVTSLGSDAYNDVLRTLQESGFAFRLVTHGARVQGHSTVPSVLNALDWFRERSDEFDVLLICRGGGSRTDLVWFDSEALGRAVATFPLPILIGIGHEQDRSVLDAVARSAKTPTAAAGEVVELARRALERTETLAGAILEGASAMLLEERRRREEGAERLVRAARNRLQQERAALDHRRRRTALGSRSLLASARERLARWQRLIPRGAGLHLGRRKLEAQTMARSILNGARRRMEGSRRDLDTLAASVEPRVARLLAHEAERLEARTTRLRLMDPRRVVERGFAVLRHESGGVISSTGQARAGERVQAELKDGILWLRSEDPHRKRGGD